MFVGATREVLKDRVSPELPLSPVVTQFGRYIKIIVLSDEIEAPKATTNVLNVLMNAASASGVPPPIVEHNLKDKLYNDIVSFCEKEELLWRGTEIKTLGTRLVRCLRDVLWYIDSHHHTFASRGFPIPETFSQFQGYNNPHLSKHRKRIHTNMTISKLDTLAVMLFEVLQAGYLNRTKWNKLKCDLEALALSLDHYSKELRQKNKSMKLVHASNSPWRTLSDGIDVFYITPDSSTTVLSKKIQAIEDKLIEKGPYCFIDLSELSPSDPKKKYMFIKTLKLGLRVPAMLLVHSTGNNYGNTHFAWQVPDASLEEAIQNSQVVIEDIKTSLPVFHSRHMRKEFVNKFGTVSSVKPAILRYFYQDLTGDFSGSETASQSELDGRVKQMFELEDPDIVTDLRHLNTGGQGQYDVFWEECSKFLEESVGTAVDDRRHTNVTHIATAISVRDFRDQVAERCPEGTKVPSVEWMRLQFWPKTPNSKTALHHTGRFKVRFRVQQRQWRKDHPDCHYAACIFRYEKQYAVLMRDYCAFYCLDDKHRIKIGEPECPVAAAERGRRVSIHPFCYLFTYYCIILQVLTEAGTRFLVGDHDFTTFSIVPSVILSIEVPEDITDSWYSGQVYVGMKDGALEPSSPSRHMTELLSTIQIEASTKPVLFLYTDGGPDHRLTYISVQLTLISLFLTLDLDYLCAARTAPFHSWRNPVERMMSIVNLGLQCVGLAREEMPKEFEDIACKAKSLKDLRNSAEETGFRDAAVQSMDPVKLKLTQVMQRLTLKEKKFKVFYSATAEQIETFCTAVLALDNSLSMSIKKAKVGQYPNLQSLLEHCCRQRHYFFDILKCGKPECAICKPIKLPLPAFEKLKHLPDPMPGDSGHYKPFAEIFGQQTTEEHRPSLKTKKSKKTLPFSASKQHVKNVDMMLQCDECGRWRLLYSKKKLKKNERELLERRLDGLMYTCGSSLEDLALEAPLDEVHVRDLNCSEPIEKLYYSAGYSPICLYCATEVEHEAATEFYPQCSDCQQARVKKR